MIEILVLCRGGRSTISFDSLPTFANLRKAIGQDVVGHDTFAMTGTTQRGTAVPIKDQPSFIRALGPRNDLTIEIREQLDVAPANPTSTAPPVIGAANPRNNNERAMAAARSPTRSSTPRNYSPSRSSNAASPATELPARFGLQCNLVTDSAGETRCGTFVKALQQVWTGERDTGHITIRDAAKGSITRTIRPWAGIVGPQVGCLCIAHAPPLRGTSAGYVWAGFNNKQIKVYDATSGAEVRTLVEHSGAVVALEVVGGYVFSASVDFTILQWNSDTMQMNRLLARHRNGVRSLCAATWNRLVSAGDDGAIIVWHSQTGEVLAEAATAHNSGIHALTHHSRYLWSGDERGVVKVWALAAARGADPSGAYGSLIMTSVAQFPAHGGSVTAIHGFNDRVISVGHDRAMHLYDAERAVALGQLLHPHDSPVSVIVGVAAVMTFRFWSGGSDRKWCSWSLESAAAVGGAADGSLSSAASYVDPSRSATPALLREASPAMGAAEDRGLASARMEVEQAVERSLVTSEEAKERAQLGLLESRIRFDRFSITRAQSAAAFAELAYSSHAQFGAILMDAVQSHTDLLRRHANNVMTQAMASDALLQRNTATFEQQRREGEKSRALLLEQLQAAHEQLGATHEEFEKAVEQRDAKEAQLGVAEMRIGALNEELRIAREEIRATQRRCQTLDSQLAAAHEETVDTRRQAEKLSTQSDADWQRRVDDLSEKLHDAVTRAENAERDERRRRTELSLEKDNSESLTRRLQQAAELARTLEEQRAETAERDRSFWQRQLEEAEAENADLKRRIEGQTAETSTEMARITAELRDVRLKFRQSQDELNATARRLSSTQAESATERSAAQQQLDDLKASWKAEADAQERMLRDKSSAVVNLESQLRERENVIATMKATSAALQTRADHSTAELQREKARHTAEVDDLMARLAACNEANALLKTDVAQLDEALTQERAAHSDTQAQLAAAEESYETTRRKAQEELAAMRDTHQRESQALAQKFKQATEAHEGNIKDMETELRASKTHIASLDHAQSLLRGELQAALETSDLTTRKNAALAAQLAETEARLRDEVTTLRRTIETKKKEHEETVALTEKEIARLRLEIDQRSVSEDELADAVRAVDAKLAVTQAELETERRRLGDVTNDFRRLSERAGAERTAAEERDREAAAVIDRLRTEHSALIVAHDGMTDERDSLLRAKRELESAVTNAREELGRVQTRHAAQLGDRDTTLEAIRSEYREKERLLAAAQSKVHELESDIVALKRQHATDSEDRRRASRLELEDARDAKDRAEAALRKLESALAVKKEELDTVRVADERRRQELEASLAESRNTGALLKVELQDTKAAWALERDRLDREVRTLRDANDELTSSAHTERRKYEAAVEERRLADRRFAEALEQHKNTNAREAASQQVAAQSARQKLTEALDAAQVELKQLHAQLDESKDSLERATLTIAERDRAVILAQRDGDHRAAILQADADATKRQLQSLQSEMAELQHRLQRDLDVERESVARERSETAELGSNLRQLEAQLAATRAEADREARRANELTNELRRVQERMIADRDFQESRIRESIAQADAYKHELRATKDQVDDRGLQVMQLETSVRDLQDKLRLQSEAAEKWRVRTQDAQVAREKAVADSASERATLESKLLETVTSSQDAQSRLQEQLQNATLRGDDLERENTRLRRDMHDLQQRSDDTMRRSLSNMASKDEELDALQLNLEDVRRQLVGATDDRHRAIHIAAQQENAAKELAIRLEQVERQLELHKETQNETAVHYRQVIDAIETECAQLKIDVGQLSAENQALQQLNESYTQDRAHYEAAMQHCMNTLEAGNAAMIAKQAILDVAAAEYIARASRIHEDWQARHRITESESASISDEVRRLTADVFNLRLERDELQQAASRHMELLAEVRVELNSLHRRYQDECTAHDRTRAEAAGKANPVSLEAATVRFREEELRLLGKVAALEADRASLQVNIDVLHSDLKRARGDLALALSGSARSSPARASSVPLSLTPDDKFVLDTRRSLVAHLAELTDGLSEAARLMAPLGQRTPLAPELESLVCVQGWLASARTRGELIQRTLMTDAERARRTSAVE